jgi:hypothetical protein
VHEVGLDRRVLAGLGALQVRFAEGHVLEGFTQRGSLSPICSAAWRAPSYLAARARSSAETGRLGFSVSRRRITMPRRSSAWAAGVLMTLSMKARGLSISAVFARRGP